MINLFGRLFLFIGKAIRHCERKYKQSKFARIGSNVYIADGWIFTYENVLIGDDVYIGPNAVFQSTYGKILIGNHVMFGPGVNIHGGSHKINEIGRLLKHSSEKQIGDDGIVIIEDDCWIGANAIILSNVTISKGTVIGAGSIVTKDIPPYTIYTGVPNQKIRERFSDEELDKHLKIFGEKSL